VGNVNTIPAEDTFYMDFRILPRYDADEVLETVRAVARMFEDRSGVKITITTEQFTKSGAPSSTESIGLMSLASAIKKVKGIDATPKGVGGGTCANYFRLAGLDAYAWETVDESAHSVDEYCKIDNLVTDSKVFASLLGYLCFNIQ
jgi:succinyl-diaminopimelate desuccinylase